MSAGNEIMRDISVAFPLRPLRGQPPPCDGGGREALMAIIGVTSHLPRKTMILPEG